MSLSELKTQVRIQKLKLKHKDAEISKLQAALRLFTDSSASQSIDKEKDEPMHSGSDDEEMDIDAEAEKGSQEEEGEEQDEDDEPRKPFFDSLSGLYFCTDCMAEIEEGFCMLCGDKYEWQEEDPLRNTESTENQAIHCDRSLVPRGNTPLLPDTMLDRYPPPAEYRTREDEYKELLRRGATRLMCETFQLEFSHPGGIYAWADQQLFEEFSGAAIKMGDSWKIHLGRRVSLDQDDEDGAAFIEGLLEDALLFPFRGPASERTFEKWETVEDTPGIWVTRLKANRDATEESTGDSDFESDDEDCSNDMTHIAQAEDKALENPPTEDTGPIRADNYEFSSSEDEEDEDSEDETVDEESDEDDDEDDDDDEEDDDEEDYDDDDEDEDMGAFITAQEPDAVWEPDDDEDDENSDEIEIEGPSNLKLKTVKGS